MRPVSIRFKCFGPYVQEQFIDFRELEKSGLFLICGETGAGKTTILDAICYALYGKSSGGLRGDISVMRCKLADKSEDTLVEFIFESDGKRYKFVRTLKYGRKNLNDSHNCMVLEGEVYVPIFENPKATVVNKKAEELIGLTYDQFRQVIILPQGQFEKLLVSNSEEKEQILVSLFHADRWQKLAEELHRRVAQRDKELEAERTRILAGLKHHGCENLSQLEEKQQEAVLARDVLRLRAAAAEQDVAKKKTALEQALLEEQKFQQLKKAENRFRELAAQQAFFDAEEAILRNADAAERIRPQFSGWQDASAKKCRATGTLEAKTAAWEKAETQLAAIAKEQEVHSAARPEYEEKKQRLGLLENARELYRSLGEKQEAAAAAGRALERAEQSQNRAQMQFAEKDALWQKAVEDQNQSIQAWQQAQHLYLQSIGGILAEKLTDGEPCPVCGSREHPRPAAVKGEAVSERELEERNRAMNRANEAATQALKQRSTAEEAKKEAETACHQVRQTAALAAADYENSLARKISGIDSEAALEIRIRNLGAQIRNYKTEEQKLGESLINAQGEQRAALAQLQAAREELTAAQNGYAAAAALWQEALVKSGLEKEEAFRAADMEAGERQRRNGELLQFRGDLSRAAREAEEQHQALAGKSAPDLEAIRKEAEAAEREVKTAATQLALAENELRKLGEDLHGLSAAQTKYETEREKVNGDLDFANRLRGRSGLSLQRYVLGVMLTSITLEANRLLANVCGGRYRLFRTDEIAGSARKSGLELEVYDSHNDQRRSVTTLSGGEKFLVALSLAIGLSTVVQAQGSGIRLEAMFIDEGFGSLDREAIGDALEVLQTIRNGAGMVGIISHVDALAESIPAKIQIIKGNQGSRCHIQN